MNTFLFRVISVVSIFITPIQKVFADNDCGYSTEDKGFALIDETVNLCDPNLGDVGLLILSVTRFGLGVIGGLIVLIIMYGGFQYASGFAQGKEENEEALNTIKHAVLGLVIVLTAYIIISFVQSTLTTDF